MVRAPGTFETNERQSQVLRDSDNQVARAVDIGATSDNPLPTTQQLKLDTVIEDTAYDLNAAAYSSVSTPTYDYIIDNVQFDFSTAESRDITITSNNGTKIYESLANTNLSVAVASINFGQSAGDSFTVAITQTSGACSVDVTAVIKNSPVALTADPVTAPGSKTTLQDSDNADITATNPLPTMLPDSPRNDAFQRLRVSEPFTIFDSKQLHDKQPLFWDETTSGSATSIHRPADACSRMTVTANASDSVIRQTKQRLNYQPGKSQLYLLTFQGSQTTGLTKRIGCFDEDNGIFFESGGDISWNIRKDGTDTESVVQTNWNLDTLDGSGVSGITLDLDATQILVIDFEWLGVGRVRVGFNIDGIVYYVHEFNHANDSSFTTVYMSSPNLPLRYEITTDGSTGGYLDHICASVMSEGGIEKTGILRSIDNSSTKITAASKNVVYPLIAIKLKDAYKDITIIPESFSVINSDKGDFRWVMMLNPTFTGTALSYSDVDGSAIQKAVGTGAQSVTDEGLVIASGYISDKTRGESSALLTALRIGCAIDGTKDELVLGIAAEDNTKKFLGSLGFRELI